MLYETRTIIVLIYFHVLKLPLGNHLTDAQNNIFIRITSITASFFLTIQALLRALSTKAN